MIITACNDLWLDQKNFLEALGENPDTVLLDQVEDLTGLSDFEDVLRRVPEFLYESVVQRFSADLLAHSLWI